jgi:HAD superfamily hydrolase (TIGR01509 family)
MTIKTVIFDFDGTITRPLLDFELIRKEMNLTNKSGSILEEMEKMTAKQKKSALEILDRHEKHAAENATLNPNAHQTLKKLAEKNINIAILTRNTRENTLLVTEKFNLKFDIIVDRTLEPTKPHPHGVLWICEKFRTPPNQTILVGDFLHDLQCAKAAGAKAVLLETRVNKGKYTKEADFVINSLEKVLKIIDNNNHE